MCVCVWNYNRCLYTSNDFTGFWVYFIGYNEQDLVRKQWIHDLVSKDWWTALTFCNKTSKHKNVLFFVGAGST
jgi:hypothetical protein